MVAAAGAVVSVDPSWDCAYWATHGQTVGQAYVPASDASPCDMRAARHAKGRAEGARPGLVSVPTTRTAGPSQEVLAQSAQRVEVLERLEKDRGFVLDKSARRLAKLRMNVGFAARAQAVTGKRAHREQAVMVTLTYAGDNSDWKPEHLTGAIHAFRQWCNRRGFRCRYVWVAELQKRGVIHYHLLAWLPVSECMPMWDRRGWWPHGMTKTERARNAVPYLLKYLSKDASKSFGSFPCGARIYGVGGLDAGLRRARAWLNRPAFVRGNGAASDQWRRAKGGGWVDPEGVIWPSEFERVTVCGQDGLRRVHQHPQLIEASGPFEWISSPWAGGGAGLSEGSSVLH